MKKNFLIGIILSFVFCIITIKFVIIPLAKQNLSNNSKNFIKEIFLPYKVIKEKNNFIQKQNMEIRELVLQHDLLLKKGLNNINFKIKKDVIDLEFADLKVFSSPSKILTGINKIRPGSAFLDYYNEKLYLLSSTGIIAHTEVNNNILKFINSKTDNTANLIRNYGVGAQIIKKMGLKNIILVTKSKKRIVGLDGFDIKIKRQEIFK